MSSTQTANSNFWQREAGPLMMLAPMEDVTDTAFRELVLRNSLPGQLQLLFTEFTSTDGMCHPVGRERVSHRLKVSPAEKQLLKAKGVRLIAQIWGNKPEKFAETARIIHEMDVFDGIDINMGCPVKNVVAHGSCSALIDQEPLAAELIAATREASPLPLSVKTRLGLKKIDTGRWMQFLLQQPVDAIILHGRIQKQMSEGAANWDEIAKAVALRNELAPTLPIIGNGDVDSLPEAHQKVENYGVDGVMIGRGIFKNPWMFGPENQSPTTAQRLDTLLLHLQLFEDNWKDERPFPMLRRFFKIYLSDFPGAAELRHQMMQVNAYDEARRCIEHWRQSPSSSPA